jgi:hypothetical protein
MCAQTESVSLVYANSPKVLSWFICKTLKPDINLYSTLSPGISSWYSREDKSVSVYKHIDTRKTVLHVRRLIEKSTENKIK